jgi:flagellar biosynthesis protein FlhF
MKIKRFTAATMREAIRLVRDEQGPDAVILSNRRLDDGVEVVAAVDYDEALMRAAARPPVGPEIAPPSPMLETTAQVAAAIAQTRPVAAKIATAAPMPAAASDDEGLSKLQSEMAAMRRLIETQLSTLTLGQFRALSPLRGAVMRELVRIGLDVSIAREIAQSLPNDADESLARRWPLQALADKLPIEGRDFLEAGGVFALVGPTGVGKTTTLAKLAARFAQWHGSRNVALISMDHYRIGAQEQLFTYGRRLGVPVYSAEDAHQLAARLKELSDCKLVLIDTAGLGPRDARLPAQLAELSIGGRAVRSLLVVAANSNASDLEQAAQRFASPALAGAILTKVDEATRLGSAMSVLIRNGLPLSYVCDGQKVPEDLKRADARALVGEAIHAARTVGRIGDHEIEDAIDADALAFA